MHTTGVKVNVDVTSPPRAHRASLGCKSRIAAGVRVRIRGGISFLKTVNTLLSESTEGRTRHKGGHAFARTVRYSTDG